MFKVFPFLAVLTLFQFGVKAQHPKTNEMILLVNMPVERIHNALLSWGWEYSSKDTSTEGVINLSYQKLKSDETISDIFTVCVLKQGKNVKVDNLMLTSENIETLKTFLLYVHGKGFTEVPPKIFDNRLRRHFNKEGYNIHLSEIPPDVRYDSILWTYTVFSY